jgi:hypothetical protein
MVNPNSDLNRAHPDWAMNFPGRLRTEARNQLVLNMARDDVKEHIFGVLDKPLTDNDIAFIKWDMNRHFSEPGWPEAAPAVRLSGLEEEGVYKLTPMHGNELMAREQTLSGAYLMHYGLNFRLRGDYDATAVVLEKVQ